MQNCCEIGHSALGNQPNHEQDNKQSSRAAFPCQIMNSKHGKSKVPHRATAQCNPLPEDAIKQPRTNKRLRCIKLASSPGICVAKLIQALACLLIPCLSNGAQAKICHSGVRSNAKHATALDLPLHHVIEDGVDVVKLPLLHCALHVSFPANSQRLIQVLAGAHD